MRMLLISFMAILALTACSSGGGDSATHENAPATTESSAEVAATPVKTGEIEIAGTLGCGHCTHHIGESCSAAVQTADGAIYILEGLGEGDAPFDKRFDGSQITVRGVAVERDGVGYVTVAGFEL